MNLLRSYSYSRVAKEDPDEVKHRKAQFLIYKILEQSENRRRRSLPRVVICKFNMKIGARLKKARKTVNSISTARSRLCVCEKIMKQLRLWRQALHGRKDAMAFAPRYV